MSRATPLNVASVVAVVLMTGSAFASSLPRVPTERIRAGGLEVRPPVIGWTGDGTGFLGGFTGQTSVPAPRHALGWAGHIRWLKWTSNYARGKGAVWLNNGIPDNAQGTFFPYAVTIHLFRPVNSVFTRLTFRFQYQGRTQTDKLHAAYTPPSGSGPGYWIW